MEAGTLETDDLVGRPRALGRWKMLALLSVAELLGMSLWFAASSVAPELELVWQLSSTESAWLTTVVQLGFVAGTGLAALLNLADVFPARRYFAAAALLGALANAFMPWAGGLAVALILRFATGFFLAGVYPPAMKMIATWFRHGRGLAIGTVVGALTVGKGAPYLLRALGFDWQTILLLGSASAVLAALLVTLFYQVGPYAFARRAFSWGLVGDVFRHRPTRLAIGGYVGHMWELYAMWTWVPAFVMASAKVSASRGHSPLSPAMLFAVSFGAIAMGGLGCIWGGWAADRKGRAFVVNLSMAISGSCCLVAGLFFGSPLYIVVPFVWLWGFFVVADSAQFSTMITEVAPSHSIGTALTLSTSLGFLITMVTVQMLPQVVDLLSWRWAFAVLALGPIAGIAFIRRFQALQQPENNLGN